MKTAANILAAFVAVQHLGFLVLEMFFWTSPTGMRIFGTTPGFAAESAALAANQGLYNGFLAAGLIWALAGKGDHFGTKVFFLSCIVVAGIFGGLTAKPTIVLVQGAPAFLALILLFLSRRNASPD